MTFQAVNAFLLHLKVLKSDCPDNVGKQILQKSFLAFYAKTNEMLKFETFFTDNDKTKILKEFTEHNSKIDNNSDKIFDLEKINKITDNYVIKDKGLTAVPSLKNGTNLAREVGFCAVPTLKNANLEIFNVSFSAVPLCKNGTNSAEQFGFSAVPKPKNGKFKIFHVGFLAVPNLNNGNGSIYENSLSAVPIQKTVQIFKKKLVSLL